VNGAGNEMENLWSDSATPFTAFRVEDCDGLPKAVFDRLPPEQGSLLSYFLYPDRTYAGALYLDVLKVAAGEIPFMSYEDDFFSTTFEAETALIETKGPAEETGSPVRLRLSLGDVKFLLLKWTFECMRWEAVRSAASDATAPPEADWLLADNLELGRGCS
jgi:hypothetical protein